MKKSVYYFGTKEIGAACLQFLIDAFSEEELEIKAVFTNNRSLGGANKSVQDIAQEKSITVFQDLKSLENLETADFIISVQYHQILKENHIAKAEELAINLHMAPLPEYRGCNQFSFAIVDEAKVFGTTIHKLIRGTDAGPIIVEDRFEIPNEIFVKDLYEITYKKSVELFKSSISDIFNGDYDLVPQEKLENSRGCSLHFRKEIETLKVIDDNWPSEKKRRYFRATYFPPFDPPKLLKNGEIIQLTPENYNQL